MLRITDDQLKVLQSNFDINNSPTKEQIHTMARQTGLPPKIIKYWFRYTLFIESQKNKDSPYNFSNPPSNNPTSELNEESNTDDMEVGTFSYQTNSAPETDESLEDAHILKNDQILSEAVQEEPSTTYQDEILLTNSICNLTVDEQKEMKKLHNFLKKLNIKGSIPDEINENTESTSTITTHQQLVKNNTVYQH